MGGSSLSPGWSAPGLPRHGLPPRHFDLLAGGGAGRAVVAHLWDSERSHRLVLLGLLIGTASRRPDATGPLSGIEAAWDLLIAAERQSAAIADDILLLPETGHWLRHCLGRLQSPGSGREPGDPPLWADVGHLHLLAAVAAMRTGLPFRLTVPVRAGRVWFPTLGCAVLPTQAGVWRTAEAAFTSPTLTVTPSGTASAGHDPVRIERPFAEPSSHWQIPHVLSLDLPDGPRRVMLHELGPYRMRGRAWDDPDRAGGPAAAPAVHRWTDLLQRAWPLLARVDPSGAEDVTACLRSIEPLPAARPFRWHSATMEDGMGGMAASEPSGTEPAAAAQFAAVLTHEAQHSKLSALLHMYSLHTPDVTRRFQVPWRDDPRPLRGVLHGVYAFTGVARFWRGHLLNGCPQDEEPLAAFEFALRRRQLLCVLPSLEQEPELTALGRRLVGRLLETVEEWQEEPVLPEPLAWAELAVDDHGLSWRSHHLVPDPDLVADLVQEWGDGRADAATPEGAWRYPRPRLVPDLAVRHLDARAVLMRMRLAPATAALVRDADDLGDLVLGARPADVELLDGRPAAAQRLYAAEIRAHSDAGPAPGTVWAGLAWTLRGCRDHEAAARALAVCPELVRHVYASVNLKSANAPDPVAVAGWLGRTVAVPR
ncbi:HEXXH motif domain-containing protein [Streptomyces alanosinicus]|uniref:HEXXH motif domain-containing protein n=1 Tax=Streptomyces alanosinicus TaxID=68171 RepID=A0A919D118_9ACTN|nr:HEXXH motif domain-containing protein [Streptomyces alanosinicus]GHE01177.1 HEXXH motif domain-containing protein [Streptomyces alanosinicus]